MYLRAILALFALMWTWMLDTDDGDSGGGEENDSNTGGTRDQGGTSAKKYDDDDANRFAANAKRDERNRWLRELGAKDEDDAKRILDEQKQARRNQQSEVENLREELQEANDRADAAEKRADQAEANLRTVRLERAIEGEILKLGVKQSRLRAAMRNADFDKATIDENGTITGADEAAKAAKDEAPELFTDNTGEQDTTTRKGGKVEPPPNNRNRSNSASGSKKLSAGFNPGWIRPGAKQN